MKKYLAIVMLLLLSPGVTGQPEECSIGGVRVSAGRLRIVVPPEATRVELKAAGELKKYLGLITGLSVPLTAGSDEKQEGVFYVANNAHIPVPDTSLDPDGFIIRILPGSVSVSGGGAEGVLYGVYELLEKFLSCRFRAPGEEGVPPGPVVLPAGETRSEPAFSFREVYYAGMDDPDFAGKMRTDRHGWNGEGDWGLWVHTMFTLVPPEKYFTGHPEYYAMMDGKRARTQLCLTNPEVLRITIEELGKRMKEQPGKRYWSVSQMDTYGACECDHCRAIDTREGSASGTMISFVNQVAEAFPDKVISTLAYQYTRKAPATIRPAHNVNIMLCTIECDRSKPLANDTSAGSFVSDLKDWTSIASDVLVWDYVIQFTNMTAPFPNLPVLKPNIELFRKFGVKGMFEQGCRTTYSEMQELRQYMLAKLLWNPNLDADSLKTGFLDGYYGPAGRFIGRYIARMEAALQQSGQTLWIYSSPMQETGSFLRPADIAFYNLCFDSAMVGVAGDSILTARVERARLPLRYAILEIARKNITGPDGFLEKRGDSLQLRRDISEQLDIFVRQAELYGVKTLHERGLTPASYGESTRRFFRDAFTPHLALGKNYTLSIPSSEKYSAEGPGSLTDGKRGSPNYFVLWQGFEGTGFSAVVDLGETMTISYAGAEFLQDLASWIFYPKSMTVGISADGHVFKEVLRFKDLSSDDPSGIRLTGGEFPGVKARYVRFEAEGERVCPGWHIGHGGKAWLFIDEMIVR